MIKRFLPASRIACAVLVLSASTVLALPTVQIGTLPSSPVPGDEVQIVISGQWPDGCTPEKFATVTTVRTGDEYLVTFTYTPFGVGPCITVVSPYKVTVPAGKLGDGTYRVIVQLTRPLLPPLVIGSGSFEVKQPLVTSFVPGVLSGGEVSIASVVSLYNNGTKTGTARVVTAFDADGAHDLTGTSISLAPGDAATLDTRPSRSGQAVQLLEIAVSPGIALGPVLERSEGGESLGRLALPLFPAPFPAGTRTVAGEVRLSTGECASPDGARRLNVTLWNAGDAPATFLVRLATRGGVPGPGGTRPGEVEVTVPARAVKQVNAFGYDPGVLCDANGAWLEIEADQPYLAYASTVRPDGPGVLPFEVFPAGKGR